MRLWSLLVLLLSAAGLADTPSFWGIQPGMTRGEVEQKLGRPDEVLPQGLVYYGRAAMFGRAEPVSMTVIIFLNSFYSTGTVTRVQARCVGEEPNVVAGRVSVGAGGSASGGGREARPRRWLHRYRFSRPFRVSRRGARRA